MGNNLEKIEELLKKEIIDVPDFPVKGILFKDITPVLLNPSLFQKCIAKMAKFLLDMKATAIVAPELRGCLFAAPLACQLGLPLVIARKKGKLPREVYSVDYRCEYSLNHLQIHRDSLKADDRVVVVDDVLATAGTVTAIKNLISQTNAKIAGYVFLVELVDLKGRQNLNNDAPLVSIIQY